MTNDERSFGERLDTGQKLSLYGARMTMHLALGLGTPEESKEYEEMLADPNSLLYVVRPNDPDQASSGD